MPAVLFVFLKWNIGVTGYGSWSSRDCARYSMSFNFDVSKGGTLNLHLINSYTLALNGFNQNYFMQEQSKRLELHFMTLLHSLGY